MAAIPIDAQALTATHAKCCYASGYKIQADTGFETTSQQFRQLKSNYDETTLLPAGYSVWVHCTSRG